VRAVRAEGVDARRACPYISRRRIERGVVGYFSARTQSDDIVPGLTQAAQDALATAERPRDAITPEPLGSEGAGEGLRTTEDMTE
jgi:hypothetical protein